MMMLVHYSHVYLNSIFTEVDWHLPSLLKKSFPPPHLYHHTAPYFYSSAPQLSITFPQSNLGILTIYTQLGGLVASLKSLTLRCG